MNTSKGRAVTGRNPTPWAAGSPFHSYSTGTNPLILFSGLRNGQAQSTKTQLQGGLLLVLMAIHWGYLLNCCYPLVVKPLCPAPSCSLWYEDRTNWMDLLDVFRRQLLWQVCGAQQWPTFFHWACSGLSLLLALGLSQMKIFALYSLDSIHLDTCTSSIPAASRVGLCG